MQSLLVIITAVLVMSIIPSIEINCPEPPTKTCTNWTISSVAEGRSVGSTGSLTCSADHSLYGNDTVQCLESGVWSQINAICVPNDTRSAVFHSFKNSNYLFVGDEKNYPDAQTSFSYVCGSLVEINTEEENNFIGSTVGESNGVWIGLHSKDGKQFEWPSGNTTTSNLYESWGNQQRNDLFIGNCVRLTSGQYWIDMLVGICNTFEFGYICEFR